MREYPQAKARVQNTLPCLIIAYSRVEGVIGNLRAANAAGVPRIYISFDGPKDEEVSDIQEELLKQISLFVEESKANVQIQRNTTNQGVALGVISAIEWFFSLEDSGIVIEDDLVVDTSFFSFCSAGVDVYRNDRRVWIISGSQYFEEVAQDTVIWTSIPQIWGWATTREKWAEIRSAIWALNSRPKLSGSMSAIEGFWSTGAKRCLTGKVDTWDLALVYVFILHGRFAVIPPVNLVKNVGFDNRASHTHEVKFPLGLEVSILPFPINWQNELNILNTTKYESLLYSKVYRLTFRHRISPVFSLLFDWIRFPASKRLPPLISRWKDWITTNPLT